LPCCRLYAEALSKSEAETLTLQLRGLVGDMTLDSQEPSWPLP
jgi:hypothetical protein